MEGPPANEDQESVESVERTPMSAEEREAYLEDAKEQLALAEAEVTNLKEIIEKETGDIERKNTEMLLMEAEELVEGLSAMLEDPEDDIFILG